METFRVNAPFGPLNISCTAEAVTSIYFLPQTETGQPESEFARRVADELQAYFIDPAFLFTVPIQLSGSPFQLRLWQALRAIPTGQVRRYGELSSALDSSARAVGNACRHNPIPLIIPCHRVISANSDGGFAGAIDGPLLTIKRWLLRHEGAALGRPSDHMGDLFADLS